MFKYERIAEDIQNKIQKGEYLADEKLPPNHTSFKDGAVIPEARVGSPQELSGAQPTTPWEGSFS